MTTAETASPVGGRTLARTGRSYLLGSIVLVAVAAFALAAQVASAEPLVDAKVNPSSDRNPELVASGYLATPDTIITSGPTGTITSNQATFTFAGNPASETAKIQCRIDGQPFADCTSPKTFTGLSEGPHTASFRAEDDFGYQDETPATRTFTVDTVSPDTQITSGPTGTITVNEATFTFGGNPAGDTAKIQCRIDGQPFADCTSPKTFTGLSDGPHTAAFRAEDAAGNRDQSPATRSFTVDAPPDTIITSGPTGTITVNEATFTFVGNPVGDTAKIQCRIDGQPFADCTSPKTFTGLSEGPHTASFRAEEADGYQDETPATRTFTVDTVSPDTQITSGPTGTITVNEATFTFGGNPAGDTAKIQCRIDGQPFADCTSPKTFTGLSDGPHTAAFRAEDAAGNRDQSPATRSFTVDAPPDTIITSGPTGTITVNEATFTFVGNPVGDTAKIQCRIDGQPFADCTSPKTFTGLSEGPHTASFRAEEADGYQDETPATRTFTVDTTVYKAKIGKVKVNGPKKVKRGKKATFKVKITNSGNIEANGVALKVNGKGVSFKTSVGKVPADKTRTVKVKLKAKKKGKVKVSFKVTSKNAGGRTVKKKITVKK